MTSKKKAAVKKTTKPTKQARKPKEAAPAAAEPAAAPKSAPLAFMEALKKHPPQEHASRPVKPLDKKEKGKAAPKEAPSAGPFPKEAEPVHNAPADVTQGNALDGADAQPDEDEVSLLEVFQDHNRHVALRFKRGRTWTRAVTIADGGSVQILKSRNDDFERNFNRTTLVGVQDALDAAEKLYGVALRHPDDSSEFAVTTLKEIIMAAKNIKAGATLADLVKQYNALAKAAGKDAVKNFKNKAEAEARIKALGPKRTKAATAKGPAKPRGQGIGAFVENLVLAQETTEKILSKVKAKFPDANTSPSSIAWYRNKLRKEGKLKDQKKAA